MDQVQTRPKGVFGWAVTSGKAAVGCGRRKNSCAEVAVEKAEGRLVE